MFPIHRGAIIVAVGTLAVCGACSTITNATEVGTFRHLVGGRPFGVAVSSQGVVYVTQQDLDSVAVLASTNSAQSGGIAVGSDPGDVVFDPAGTAAFVTNFAGGTVSKVSVGAGTQVDTVGVGSQAFRLALEPGGSRLLVATNLGVLHVLDTASLAQVDSVVINTAPNGLAVMGDSFAYVSSTAAGTVQEVSLRTKMVTRTFPVGGVPQEVVLSADGSRIFVAGQEGFVRAISRSTGAVVDSVAVAGAPFGMALRRSDNTLVVTTIFGAQAFILRTGPLAIDHTVDLGGRPRRVVVGAGGVAVIANEGGWVDVLP